MDFNHAIVINLWTSRVTGRSLVSKAQIAMTRGRYALFIFTTANRGNLGKFDAGYVVHNASIQEYVLPHTNRFFAKNEPLADALNPR